MVASDRRTITVELVQNSRRNAYLSVDGGKALRLNMGDVTTIKKSNLETKLVRLKDRSFYDVVNMKFMQVCEVKGIEIPKTGKNHGDHLHYQR